MALSPAGPSHHLGDEGIEVAAGEEKSGQARAFRGLDVAVAVADDKTAFVPYRPVRHQIVDHAGRGFAPMVFFEIALDDAVGVMRAVPDVVDAGALRR